MCALKYTSIHEHASVRPVGFPETPRVKTYTNDTNVFRPFLTNVFRISTQTHEGKSLKVSNSPGPQRRGRQGLKEQITGGW